MDITLFFKNDGSYFSRHKPVLFIFQLLAIGAACINSIFSAGWLSGLTAEYLPQGLSWFLAFMFAVGLEVAKKTTATELFKERAKFRIWDVFYLSGTAFLFVMSVAFALNGLSAKEAMGKIERLEQLDSSTTNEPIDGKKTASVAPTLLQAKTLQGQISSDKARADLTRITIESEKLKDSIETKKYEQKKGKLKSIDDLKKDIFSAGWLFVIGVEVFFLYACWLVGSILATKPESKTERPSDEEIKKQKARYSAARARFKKDAKQSDADIMSEIETMFLEFGIDVPDNKTP